MSVNLPRLHRQRKKASGITDCRNAADSTRSADMNAAEKLYADEEKQGQQEQKKKKHNKAVIAAAAAISILFLAVAPLTYSYLTASSDTVINTFAGGAISIKLDEALVDTDGNPQNDEPRVQENTYKVVPGAELSKDPTVTVLEGSETCYVYLYVENLLDEEYFSLDYSDDWTAVATTGTKTLYVYKTTVDAADEDVVLTPIFTTVTVSDELTSEQIAAMGEVQIKVQAYAIQAEGVDVESSIQTAADYFAGEFDFEWTDVDKSVEIDGLMVEEKNSSSDEAEGSSSTDEANSSATENSGASDSSSGLSGTDSGAEDSGTESSDTGNSDTGDNEANSSDSSSDTSSGNSSDDTSAGSTDDTNSSENQVNTQSVESSDDTSTLNIVE